MVETAPASPCMNVCVLDADRCCTGCGRTVDEIARWRESQIPRFLSKIRRSYGQVVKTNGDGYYKAAFHLHNDNLGDPLLVEAKGEQQTHKIEFDPKDLEAERKLKVNFGTGCDTSAPPAWLWWGVGGVAAAAGGFVGMKIVRSERKYERAKGKSEGKRKT